MSILPRIQIVAILLLSAAFSTPAAEPAAPPTKKLIEFGWDEPDPAFMRKHIASMEQTPFDGCVFHIDARNAEGKTTGRFTWEAWSTRAFTEADLRHAVQDLQATPFKRLTHNFLRFNTTPANLDWFDDHSAVIHIMRQGLLPIVSADHQKYRDTYSFAFGIWLDYDWRNRGWNESDPSKNYFTPESFGSAVRKALETSDEYVWIYTETPRWWSDDTAGKPLKLPQSYIDAVRKARQGLAKD